MRWVVLGASGFIGRNLLRRIRADGGEAIGTGNRHLVDELIRFDVEHDSIHKVIEPIWFRDEVVVVHCVAYGSIDQTLREKERSRMLAVDSTTRLMAELASVQARQVFLSSNQVFDGSQ